MNDTTQIATRARSAQVRLSLLLVRDVCEGLGWRYAAFIVVVVFLGLTSLLPPQLFRIFTEGAQTVNEANARVLITSFALFGAVVAIAMLVSSAGNILLQEWLRLRIEADLRRRVMRRLHQLPLDGFDGAQRGDWLTRMTNDLGQAESFLTESLPSQVRLLAILLGSGVLFFVYSGALGIIPLVTAVLLALINLKVQQMLSPLLGELRDLHGGVIQLLIESLEGIRTIRSHACEPFVQRHFESRLNDITQKSLRVVRLLGALMGGTELIGKLLVTGCLSVAAWSLARRQLTLQDVLVYPFFIGLFYDSAQSLASHAYDWNRYFSQGGRLAELLYGQRGEPLPVGVATGMEPRRTQSLALAGAVLSYDEQPIAGPIDFTVSRGEVWAIMGPSGCGKSTLLEVLAGLRAASAGRAICRGLGGKSIWQSRERRNLQLPSGLCAFVEQHPYIFEGTLRDNLTLGNPLRLSDTVIWSALERSGLFLLARTRGGLDFHLGDRGQNLSVGERYRIALCRALLLDRPFLLLDEPFAALDEVSVAIVVKAIAEERQRRGVVVVTHYLPESFNVDGVFHFKGFRPEKTEGIKPRAAEPRLAAAGAFAALAFEVTDLSGLPERTPALLKQVAAGNEHTNNKGEKS